jgi:beta-lactamase class A
MGLVILGIAGVTLFTLLRPSRNAVTVAAAGSGHRQPAVVAQHPLASKGTPAQLPALSRHPPFDPQPLLDQLRAAITPLQGTYAVAVVDCSTGAMYGLDLDTSFGAASVNKLEILVDLYQRAENGQLDLDQTLTLSDADIQHYGTGVIQAPNAPRTYSLRQLAALMVEESDNTAAYVLEQYLGHDAIQSAMRTWGLRQTSLAPSDMTTPADAATLLERLYQHKLLSAQSTDVLLTLLTHTVFTDRIAAGVPAGVPVAHKVGTDVGVFNDAGLVLAPQRPFVLVVLSSGADETEAETGIALVTKDVYTFETGLPGNSSR